MSCAVWTDCHNMSLDVQMMSAAAHAVRCSIFDLPIMNRCCDAVVTLSSCCLILGFSEVLSHSRTYPPTQTHSLTHSSTHPPT